MSNDPSLYFGLYVAVSLSLRLPLKVPFKVIAALLILICSAKYKIYSRFGGWLHLDLAPSTMILMEGLHGAVLIAAVLCAINDVITIIVFAAAKLSKRKWRLPHKIVSSCIVIFAWGMGLYGSISQTLVPDVKEVEVAIDKLPPAFDGFTIVQLTDLHIGPINKGDWLSKIVDRTNELKGDLIVITGDLVDGFVPDLGDDFNCLKDLKAPYGVFGVTGNHEYFSGAEPWLEYWETLGIKFLQNEHVELIKDSAVVTLGGVNDRRGPETSVEKAFEGAGDHARILLAHEPTDGVKDLQADFIISGHTHGGIMIFLKPSIGSRYEGLVSGLYDYKGAQVYVSNGTGIWSGFSCRFLMPPEITLITLRRGG